MSHPGEELVILLAGRMRFTVDGREYAVGTGDSIHFRTLLAHSWAQSGRRARARDLARRPLVVISG